MTVAGRGLAILASISDQTEVVVKYMEEYLANGDRKLYGIAKQPAFIGPFLKLVGMLTHFTSTLMRGDNKARALFRGIIVDRITPAYHTVSTRIFICLHRQG
jgi:hypothetical protein